MNFGETWQHALTRAFKEEPDVRVSICGSPLVMENISTQKGTIGHEIAFVADVKFPDRAFEGADSIIFAEDHGVNCVARWFDPDDLVDGKICLYPLGLKTLLQAKN